MKIWRHKIQNTTYLRSNIGFQTFFLKYNHASGFKNCGGLVHAGSQQSVISTSYKEKLSPTTRGVLTKAGEMEMAAWRLACQLWKGTLNRIDLIKAHSTWTAGIYIWLSAQKFDFHGELHTLWSQPSPFSLMRSGSVAVMCKSQNGINTAIGQNKCIRNNFIWRQKVSIFIDIKQECTWMCNSF